MNYYNNIKNELVTNEINRKVKNYSINSNDLKAYYNVGKMLSEAGRHYGEGIIKEYSKRLTHDLGKGYSKRNLWLMIRFYFLQEKVQTLSAQLSWSHYCELLSFDNVNKNNYYIEITIKNNLSVRQLREKVRLNEYKINIDGRYNYIDLLLYNIKYKCYVVVELKMTELKKEHTGQIMIYELYR